MTGRRLSPEEVSDLALAQAAQLHQDRDEIAQARRTIEELRSEITAANKTVAMLRRSEDRLLGTVDRLAAEARHASSRVATLAWALGQIAHAEESLDRKTLIGIATDALWESQKEVGA